MTLFMLPSALADLKTEAETLDREFLARNQAVELGHRRLTWQMLRQTRDQLVKARRYREAIPFQEEMRLIEQRLQGKMTEPAIAWFFPHEMDGTNGPILAREGLGYLHRWSGPATWKLAEIPAGGYEVLVEYTCPNASRIRVKEARFFTEGTLPATKDNEIHKFSLGLIKLSKGQGSISLELLTAEAANRFRLHALALVSQAP